MKTICRRCSGTGSGNSLSGASYACDSCGGLGYFGQDEAEAKKKEDEAAKVASMVSKVEKTLSDVEFYSPTMPMPWRWYHDTIRDLIKEINKKNK